MVYKGTHPTIDSYSAFRDNVKCSETTLPQELKKRNITDVYVCGLAYDCCVGKYVPVICHVLKYRFIFQNIF